MSGRIAQEPGTLAGITEIAQLLGDVSRQRAAVVTMTEGFPRPIDNLRATPVYRKAEVEAWIRQRQQTAPARSLLTKSESTR